jgi:hypothetical protein
MPARQARGSAPASSLRPPGGLPAGKASRIHRGPGQAGRLTADNLLAMAVCRFASLLDGLYEGWLDDPDFRPIVERDLADGQHRNPDPVGRPEFFTTAYFHTPDGLADEIERAGFTGTAVYGVEGPGWPLRPEWADPQRREHILFAARPVETQPSLIGFSDHLIAAATKAWQSPAKGARQAADASVYTRPSESLAPAAAPRGSGSFFRLRRCRPRRVTAAANLA